MQSPSPPYAQKMTTVPGSGGEVASACPCFSLRLLYPSASAMLPVLCAVRRGWASALLVERALHLTGLEMG